MLKSLNLLSPEERKEIRHERMFMIVRNLTGIFVSIFIFASVTMVIAKQTIKNEADQLAVQAKAVDDRSAKINAKVSAINNMLSDIEKIQKGDTDWGSHVLSIIQTIPQNISILTLDVDKETLIFTFNGTAATRADFLTMKTAFEKAKKLFKEISTPALGLTAVADIPFTFSGRLIIAGLTPTTQKALPSKTKPTSEE